MIDSLGYMEYDFSSLNKLRVLDRKESADAFMHFFEMKRKYKFQFAIDFYELSDFLIDSTHLVMNNDLRRKGKKKFFTGNAVEAEKKDLLDFISKPIKMHDLIVPLFIVPITDREQPPYLITTQEDPIFEIMIPS